MYLIACETCDRQYDVGHHDEGTRIRCLCGEALIVRHLPAHEPRVQRCPGCGAALEGNKSGCSYCRIEINPLEMSFSSLCPHCHARMTETAAFCMDCGKEMAPQFLVAVPEDTSCPRCQGALVSRRIGKTAIVECAGCLGIWIPAETFDAACRDAEQRKSLSNGLFAKGPAATPEARGGDAKFRYLPCLYCRDMMVPRNFGGNSGVVIDVCAKHGVWLDEGEFPAILRYIQAGQDRSDGSVGGGLKPEQRPQPSQRYTPSPEPSKRSALGNSLVDVVVDIILSAF